MPLARDVSRERRTGLELEGPAGCIITDSHCESELNLDALCPSARSLLPSQQSSSRGRRARSSCEADAGHVPEAGDLIEQALGFWQFTAASSASVHFSQPSRCTSAFSQGCLSVQLQPTCSSLAVLMKSGRCRIQVPTVLKAGTER
jgi:hypothetical protein